jgi:hypothetical protein
MKNSNQQHEVKNFYAQENELENEKFQLRGRPKKNGQKRSAARKSKTTTIAVPTATENVTRKAVKSPGRKPSRFKSEGTLFRDSYTETPFGHDDYQLRQEMGFDRFANDDLTSAYSVDAVRSLPMELEEEEGQGTYSDQQLIQEIRRAIERDSAVSSAAQKIQLTAKNGVVIIKGTVSSEQEQMILEDKAVALAGFGQVVNQLEVIEDMID